MLGSGLSLSSSDTSVSGVLPQGILTIGNIAGQGMSIISCPESATGSILDTNTNGRGEDIVNIGFEAFRDCTNLIYVNIPDITILRYSAFENCTSLRRAVIPDTCTTIAGKAFKDCTSLNSAVIGTSVTAINEQAFLDCESLKEINIPNSVTSIGNSTFSQCIGVQTITIGNSLQTIGNFGFSTCREVISIDLPSTVTSIGNSAFEACLALSTLNIRTLNPPTLGTNVFQFADNLYTIHVPSNSTFGETYGGRTVVKDLPPV